MTSGTHARGDAEPPGPPEPPEPQHARAAGGRERRTTLGWRFGTPIVVLLSGALFAVSATNSQGTDLRPGRYGDLASLVKTESNEYAELEARVRELNAEVEALTGAVDDTGVRRLRQKVEEMRDPAGLTPRSGTGVTVTLSDAPEEVIEASEQDVRLLVVHQQDIQALVNAMWRGGATAVTIEGQRIVSTTGIKCAGNSVQLHSVPYPQPYVIQAVGNQATILEAIEEDEYLELYREQAEAPDIQIGWDLELEEHVTAPAYEGLLDLTYAEPIR